MRKNCLLILLSGLLFINCPYGYYELNEDTSGLFRFVSGSKLGVSYGVCVDSNYAYVTNNDGVVILDISQPEKPVKAGLIHIGDAAFGIKIRDNLAYIAGSEKGFFIADIKDPENPGILSQFNKGGTVFSVDVKGSRAFVSYYQKEFDILDISNPSNPVKAGSFENGNIGGYVKIIDGEFYFLDFREGLKIIDVSVPSSPKVIKTIPNTTMVRNFCIKDNLMYLSCYTRGIIIISLAEENLYETVGQFNDGGESNGVWIHKDYLFVSANGELEVLNVSNPESPEKIGGIKNTKALHGMFFEGKYLYLTSAKNGFCILEFIGK